MKERDIQSEMRDMFAAGKAFRPSREAKERTIALVGAGSAVALVKASWWKLWGAKTLAVLAVTGAAGAGVHKLTREPERAPVVLPKPPPPQVIVEPPPAPIPAASEAPPVETSAPKPTPPPLTLADEVAILDDARAALDKHDPERALKLLGDHDRRFPHGELAPDAASLRVDALFARGDRARAAALASELVAKDPTGPHAAHLRSFIGD